MLLLIRSIRLMGLSAGLTCSAFAASFTFTTISDPLGTSLTEAFGINDAGQTVGIWSNGGNTNGFLDSGGIFTTVDDPLATGGTVPIGINDAGQISGYYYAGGYHGFVESGGIFTTITDPLATGPTYVGGINDSGQIVGQYEDAAGYHEFVDNGGTFTTITDPSQILPSGPNAGGINNAGQIVGGYSAGSVNQLYQYDGGIFTTIGYPSAYSDGINATGINDAGQIVGYYGSSTNGFLDNGGTYSIISDPLATTGTLAYGINDTGEIVGYYEGADGSEGFVATSTASSPEPSTLVMGPSAFLGISLLRRFGLAFSRDSTCPILTLFAGIPAMLQDLPVMKHLGFSARVLVFGTEVH